LLRAGYCTGSHLDLATGDLIGITKAQIRWQGRIWATSEMESFLLARKSTEGLTLRAPELTLGVTKKVCGRSELLGRYNNSRLAGSAMSASKREQIAKYVESTSIQFGIGSIVGNSALGEAGLRLAYMD
jgi:hypothetical protein